MTSTLVDLDTLKMTLNTMKKGGQFSQEFWRFIKEEVGIHYIYPSQHSYLKKKVSFEERHQKIEKMLERVNYEDDKLSPSEQALAKWSDEALELNLFIKKLGLLPDICIEDYLLNFFETLYFKRLGITALDPVLLKFEHLRILNLSFNKIQKIENLPPNLKELYLTGNQIENVEGQCNSLIHLGLSYNRIRNYSLYDITELYPNLFCLDVSFNDIDNMNYTIDYLKKLQSLKMIFLLGNPIVLVNQYREIIKQNLPNLFYIDNIKAFADSESPKKRKKRLQDNVNNQIEIKNDISLDFQLRLLSNIDGIYLTEDVCKLEILDTLEDNEKSSVFWLSFKNHLGQVIESEKKIWIQHFQVDRESNTGKVDFLFKQRILDKVSYEMREWIKRDIEVELWETRPKTQEKKNEDETITKEVVLNEQGKPIIEKRLRGIMLINLQDWVYKPELGEEDIQVHMKQHFYDSKYKKVPEFMFSNYNTTLKESEKSILEEVLNKREEEENQLKQNQSEQNLKNAQGAPPGKGGKPDPKKDAKGGAAAAKKGAVTEDKNAPKNIQIDYPDVPAAASFHIFEKNFNYQRRELLGDKQGGEQKKQGGKEQSIDDKKAKRTKEVIDQFQVVRGFPFSLVFKARLNLPEEVEVKKEPEVVVDPKKKK